MSDDGKVTKSSVNYRHGNAEKRCDLCTMFRVPDKCTLVRGDIGHHMLCDEFKAKSRA